MFAKNVGGLDKTLRIVIGALLVLAFFLTDGPYSPLYLLGIIPLVTGLLGTCPIYSLIGVNTCPMKK